MDGAPYQRIDPAWLQISLDSAFVRLISKSERSSMSRSGARSNGRVDIAVQQETATLLESACHASQTCKIGLNVEEPFEKLRRRVCVSTLPDEQTYLWRTVGILGSRATVDARFAPPFTAVHMFSLVNGSQTSTTPLCGRQCPP